MSRLRAQAGMTLIEVMLTTLIIAVGTLATLGTYSHFSRAALKARHHSVLTSVAQREIERLRPITYAKLGLTALPSTQQKTEAPLSGRAATEDPVTGGVVLPGGEEFTYENVRLRVWRYVTLRVPTCTRLKPKLDNELAGLLNATLSEVSAALPDPCASVSAKTKRLTVSAAEVDQNDGSLGKVVTLSTIVQDPKNVNVLPINTNGLSVKPVTDPLTATTPVAAPSSTQQSLTLLDTRCSSGARTTPVSHTTRDTAQGSWGCFASGPAATLMTLAGVGGSTSDPVADFSTDVTRAAQGGLVLLRDDRAGSCSTPSSSLVYSNPETARRSFSLHKWASTVPGGQVQIPSSDGRASFTIYSSTVTGDAAPARLCVTLQAANTGTVLGSSDFQLRSWPGKVTELTTAFDLAGYTFQTNERLVLTVRVPSDSGSDLRILYDHPAYPSTLSFTTIVGKEFT